jgi:hypothetical protein
VARQTDPDGRASVAGTVTYGILLALCAWYALLAVLAESVRARGIAMPRALFAALTLTGGAVVACALAGLAFGAIADMAAGRDARLDEWAKRIMTWSACVGVASSVLARVLVVRGAAQGVEG